MKLSKRNMITIALFLAVAIIGAALYSNSSKKQAESAAYAYNYSAEVMKEEGAYQKLRDYADDIFVEMYCNTKGIVLQYAFTEYGLDFQRTELDAVIFTNGEATNALYFLYRIPEVTIEESGKFSENGYQYGLLAMRNITREGRGQYSVEKFDMLVEDAATDAFQTAIDTNKEKILSDANQRNMLAYGFLYNIDENYASQLAAAEKERILAYLLALQQNNAAEYSIKTSENGDNYVTANIHMDQFVSTPVSHRNDAEKPHEAPAAVSENSESETVSPATTNNSATHEEKSISDSSVSSDDN